MAEQEPPETPKPSRPGISETAIAMRPRNFEELWGYCKIISDTDFVPPADRGKPGQVLAKIQYGNDVGLPAMQSLRWIAHINGQPTIHSDGFWMLVKASPIVEDTEEEPHDESGGFSPIEAMKLGYAEVSIKVRGRAAPYVRRFYYEEAKTAGLIERSKGTRGDGPWITYPGMMLLWRARHRCASAAVPHVLGGLVPTEIAGDYDMEITAEKKEPPIAIAQPKPKAESMDEFKARQAEKATPKEKKDAKDSSDQSKSGNVSMAAVHESPANVEPAQPNQPAQAKDIAGADARESQAPDGQGQPAEKPEEEKAGSASQAAFDNQTQKALRDRFGRIVGSGKPPVDTSAEFKEKLIAWIHDATTEDLLAGSTDPRGGKDASKCYLRTVFNDKEEMKKLTNEDKTAVLNEYDKERRQRP